MGDRLSGVILYHVHPDEALTQEEIRQRSNLTTALGQALKEPQAYIIVVDASSANETLLRGVREGNVARVSQQIQVCETTVHVIDQVLLPATGVNTLPDPGPATTTYATRSTAIEDVIGGVLDYGIATGIGRFIDCTVELFAAGVKLNTTTAQDGSFGFPGIPECALQDATLTLPAGLAQVATCVDDVTGLPPAYSFSTVLSQFLGGGFTNKTVNPTSPNAPLNLSPLANLISNVFEGPWSSRDDGNTPFDFGDIFSLALDTIGDIFGFDSTLVDDNEPFGVLEDIIGSLFDTVEGSFFSSAANAISMITNKVGGDTLTALLPGIDPQSAIKAIETTIGGISGSDTRLTDDFFVQDLLAKAFDLLVGTFDGRGDDSTLPLQGEIVNRKLLQSSSTGETDSKDAILAAVSKPIALLNRMALDAASQTVKSARVASAEEDLSTTNSTSQNGSSLLSRCTRVAQLYVSPAAARLGQGEMSVQDFESMFAPQKVLSAVATEPVPTSGSTEFADLANPEVETTLSPVLDAKEPDEMNENGSASSAISFMQVSKPYTLLPILSVLAVATSVSII